MSMLLLSIPWWEFVFRAVVIYGFLLLMLRLTGKRQVGQLAPFDFVLLLVLSNAVQNSLNAGDNSLIGGMISATTLVLLNAALGYLTYRNKKIEGVVDGKPQILIHNGVVFKDALEASFISEHELRAALRRNGCATVAEVHLAMLETNGAISVIPRQSAPPATAVPPSAS